MITTEDLNFQISENELGLTGENVFKLNRLRRSYFKSSLNIEKTYIDLLKESSKFYYYQLPPKFNEFFLTEKEQPVFWILESPLAAACEEFLKSSKNSKNTNGSENSIKQYFHKWIVAKNEQHKKMFASMAISLLKNSSESLTFLDRIYCALLLIYDRHFRNNNAAIELLIKIDEELNNLPITLKIKDELLYYTMLYRGFAYYTTDDFDEASKSFSDAINQNANGITAKFFLASCYARLNESQHSEQLIKEIYNYDISRLNYAIDTNNPSLLGYFFKTSLFPNIFSYRSFECLSDFIESEIILPLIKKTETIPDIGQKFDKFLDLELEEYYDDEIKNSIHFISKTYSKKNTDNNPFVAAVGKSLVKKYESTLQKLKELIKDKIVSEFKKELTFFDNKIADIGNVIEQLSKEIIDFKEEIKKKHNMSASLIEDYIKQRISEVEDMLNNIHLVDSLNPQKSFKTSMTYNFIISIVVFAIGCIAGYSNYSTELSDEFYLILGKLILTGVKWSSLTFLVGIIFSAASAGLVVIDRSNEKEKLSKVVADFKKERELRLDLLKKETAEKEKSITENFNERIESNKKKIEELKTQRDKTENSLNEKAEEKLKPLFEKIDAVNPA